MAEQPLPSVRASDADRERVAEVLQRAAADGQLDVDELDDRLQAAYGARTREELVPLTADLQPPAEAPARSVPVRRGKGGSRFILAVMTGTDRQGLWRLAARSLVLTVMGGTSLDLNDVELASEETAMTVITVMGGVSIRVPEGLRVEVSRFALMGDHDVKLTGSRPPEGAPVLRLRLFSVMGGAEVRRGRRKKRGKRRDRLEPPPPQLP